MRSSKLGIVFHLEFLIRQFCDTDASGPGIVTQDRDLLSGRTLIISIQFTGRRVGRSGRGWAGINRNANAINGRAHDTTGANPDITGLTCKRRRLCRRATSRSIGDVLRCEYPIGVMKLHWLTLAFDRSRHPPVGVLLAVAIDHIGKADTIITVKFFVRLWSISVTLIGPLPSWPRSSVEYFPCTVRCLPM